MGLCNYLRTHSRLRRFPVRQKQMFLAASWDRVLPVTRVKSVRMAQVTQTRKKLREAKFFLGRMSEAQESSRLDKEDFDFYLSAFLSAGRSVIGFFHAKENRQYRRWFRDWRMALADSERKLLNDMTRQRDLEVHEQGADVHADIEHVPVGEAEPGNRSHPAYGISWAGPPGVPSPTIGTKVHYFQIGDTREQAVETCKRYLQLLDKLVRDFEGSFSAE